MNKQNHKNKIYTINKKYHINNKIITLIYCALLIILHTNYTYAIGIAPSNAIYREDGTGQIRIINSEHKNMQLEIDVTNELTNYITLEKNQVYMTSTDAEYNINYHIHNVKDLTPGDHIGFISVKEVDAKLPTNTLEDNKTSIVNAVNVLLHTVVIEVPYTGKYAQTFTQISSDQKDITFTTNIMNKGTEEINEIDGTITIASLDNNVTQVVFDEKTNLKSQDSIKITKTISHTLKPGIYYAAYDITYDTKKTTTYNTFKVGEKKATISSIDIMGLQDDIGKITLGVEMDWNQPALVYAKIMLNNKEIETDTILLTKKSQITGYIENPTITDGNYTIKILIYTDEQIQEVTHPIEVRNGKVSTLIATHYEPEIINATIDTSFVKNILMSLAILLLIGIISAIVYFSTKNQRKLYKGRKSR